MQEITNINEENQEEIQDLVQNRHVPRRGLYDTTLVGVEKNKPKKKVNLVNIIITWSGVKTKKDIDGYITQYGSK